MPVTEALGFGFALTQAYETGAAVVFADEAERAPRRARRCTVPQAARAARSPMREPWIPAFAGMTGSVCGMTV
jgi:hypothetical protein